MFKDNSVNIGIICPGLIADMTIAPVSVSFMGVKLKSSVFGDGRYDFFAPGR